MCMRIQAVTRATHRNLACVLQADITYPHLRIPAARLLFVILRVSVFSSTWGNPEVGGGDNCWGSFPIFLI